MADLGQGRADHESAERLGRGQARRAAGRRAVLDPRHAGRAEGPLCAVPAVLLGHLELQQEQVGGQEPACPSVAAGVGREDGRGQRRLRPAAVRQADDVQDLGRGRAAEGHALSTTPIPTITRSCRSPPRRRRRRSPSRSTPRPIQTKMCRALLCRASRWKRRSPGPKARSKASCGADCARSRDRRDAQLSRADADRRPAPATVREAPLARKPSPRGRCIMVDVAFQPNSVAARDRRENAPACGPRCSANRPSPS